MIATTLRTPGRPCGPRWKTAWMTVSVGGALAAGPSVAVPARAEEPPPVNLTATASVSAEILELAANLTLLEELDLLAQLEVLELMPLLEDSDED